MQRPYLLANLKSPVLQGFFVSGAVWLVARRGPWGTRRSLMQALFLPPVREFGLVAVGLNLGDFFVHDRLRVLHRLVVDRRADFAQTEIEQQACLQAADVVVEVLGAVTL